MEQDYGGLLWTIYFKSLWVFMTFKSICGIGTPSAVFQIPVGFYDIFEVNGDSESEINFKSLWVFMTSF